MQSISFSHLNNLNSISPLNAEVPEVPLHLPKYPQVFNDLFDALKFNYGENVSRGEKTREISGNNFCKLLFQKLFWQMEKHSI